MAAFLTNASVTVFPCLPAGFAGAGMSTAAVVGIGAGVAAVAAGGVAIANSGSRFHHAAPRPRRPGPDHRDHHAGDHDRRDHDRGQAFESKVLTRSPTGKGRLPAHGRHVPAPGPNQQIQLRVRRRRRRKSSGDCKVSRDHDLGRGALAPSATFGDPCRQTARVRLMAVFGPPNRSGPGHSQRPSWRRSMPPAALPASSEDSVSGETASPPPALAWNTELAVAGGTGQVVANGSSLAFAGKGRSSGRARPTGRESHRSTARPGYWRPGTWRFELGATAASRRAACA